MLKFKCLDVRSNVLGIDANEAVNIRNTLKSKQFDVLRTTWNAVVMTDADVDDID